MAKRKLEMWYEEGIRFECQSTGKCCTNHGEYSYVYVNADEEKGLAKHLDLSLKEFRKLYTSLVEGRRTLISKDDACVFLEGSRCGVYPARPVQCSSWPFWRGNLDEKVWFTEVAPFCAGVGKGRLYTRDEIETLAEAAEDE